RPLRLRPHRAHGDVHDDPRGRPVAAGAAPPLHHHPPDPGARSTQSPALVPNTVRSPAVNPAPERYKTVSPCTSPVIAALAAALTLGGIASPAHAATAVVIAVAPTGNDNNPGTPDQPVATPARAQQLARAQAASNDVVVQLAGGTYRLAAPL